MLTDRAMSVRPDKAARDLLAFYLEEASTPLLGEEPIDRFAERCGAGVPRSPMERVARRSRAGWRVPPSQADAPLADPRPTRRRRVRATGRRRPTKRPMARARGGAQRATLDELRDPRRLRRLRAEARRDAARVRRRQSAGAADARRRGAGPRRGSRGPPFVGRSGKLLDRMLAAIGLDRTCVYIANVVPWRPPGNRTPTPQETQVCLPFIRRQIELVDPEVLVCLGGPSAETLLGQKTASRKIRGRWFSYRHRHARDPRDADLPSGLSAAQPAAEALRLAGFSRDQEGAGRLSAALLFLVYPLHDRQPGLLAASAIESLRLERDVIEPRIGAQSARPSWRTPDQVTTFSQVWR